MKTPSEKNASASHQRQATDTVEENANKPRLATSCSTSITRGVPVSTPCLTYCCKTGWH